ncbi:phage portal protein [Pseudogemmobacter sonorensis]|uniref:phage portal protein n=1 Tax=Pseudogemmobacter sonorensis TaxID=2989681 RepID=UPI0036C1A18E
MKLPAALGKLFRRSAGIEAGGSGWRWQGHPSVWAPQEAARAARGPAKARATAAALNSAIGARAVEAWTASLVGRAWQTQAQHPDRDTARRLAEEFEALIGCLLPVLVRAIVRDGECFARIVTGPEDFRILPLPCDQVDPQKTEDLGNGAKIVSGIEYDAQEHVVAFHILPQPPGDPFAAYSNPIRVPAEEVVHAFDRQFPGQVRGLSFFTPVLLRMADYDAASDAMLKALQTQALFAGFVSDVSGGAAGFEGQVEAGALNLALEPGTVRLLPPGSDIKFSQPGSGLSDQVSFCKLQLHEIAAGLGLEYARLSGDLSEASYSSTRFGHLDHQRRAEMLQRTIVEGQILRPIWRRWIAWKALTGEIPASDATGPDWQRVRFIAPAQEAIDPLKEINADVRALEAGLTSRAALAAKAGRDLAELDEEIEADRQRQAGQKDAAA